MTREYARAPAGQRVHDSVPRHRGTVTTMQGALGLDGVRAMMTIAAAWFQHRGYDYWSSSSTAPERRACADAAQAEGTVADAAQQQVLKAAAHFGQRPGRTGSNPVGGW